ncbi:hypothetical protein BELL_1601g00020 [Botrytis elliptica]|uniref:Uncharacterized protein n=1 Tax=Botrytis elliptica TaxID=278938 RepID=A0A4Z1HW04_9HELO|nr:hypothetical protein EAE99_008017 [Botrytis elliptica]TGO53215.1 hypothetical protein BELL_1601g00020 [Botrytis elliptica]
MTAMSAMTTSVHPMDARPITSINLSLKPIYNRDKSIKSLFVISSNRFEHNNNQKPLEEATTSTRTNKDNIDNTITIQLQYNKTGSEIMTEPPWIIEEADRCRYGLKEQEVIATNQLHNVILGSPDPDSTWSTISKVVSAVHSQNDQQYIQLFETKLRSPLKAFILSLLSKCNWTLNVLHLGFEDNGNKNPIVIHIFIQEPHYFKNNKTAALEIVKGIERIVYKEYKVLEKNPNEVNDTGVNLTKQLNNTNSELTPHPGSSIGRKNGNAAGSLSCFLKHKGDAYSLTCRHVVFTEEESPEAYRYESGKEKLHISVPTTNDLNNTRVGLKSDLESEIKKLNTLQEKVSSPKKIETQELIIEVWTRLYADAAEYNNNAGYIYAAPESWHKNDNYKGVLDWAIICDSCIDPENALPQTNFLLKDDVRKFIKYQKVHVWSGDQSAEFDAKYQALQDSAKFNIKYLNPSISTLSENSIYFKAPSRTSDWKACVINSIKSIKHSKYQTSDEYAFVGKGLKAISAKGDSGALIYEISAGTPALIPMAMVWGGNVMGTVIVEGFLDVTYATPMDVLLEDIENEMEWDRGSLEFL